MLILASVRGVAQVVERLVRDQEVASSSLVTPTMRKPLYSLGIWRFFLFRNHLTQHL